MTRPTQNSRPHEGDASHPHCAVLTVQIADWTWLPTRRRLMFLRDVLMMAREGALGASSPAPPTSGTWISITGNLAGELSYLADEDDFTKANRMRAFLNERIQGYSNLGVDAELVFHVNTTGAHRGSPGPLFRSINPPGPKEGST